MRTIVLVTDDGEAAWVMGWPYPHFVKHAWPYCWNNTFFRNEGPVRSSDLIRFAVERTIETASTLDNWGAPPPEGIITMIDAKAIRSTNPGCCYKKAGWRWVGRTKTGKEVLWLPA